MEEDTRSVFLAKAYESLAGARSEFANQRFNNCANRAYHACFQAAIYALSENGIEPRNGQWGHGYVQAEFNGRLINRRKLYPAGIRDVLDRTYMLRQTGDYRTNHVTEVEAFRALRRTAGFLAAIRGHGGDTK
ncbi:MAG: HEPN domain-containing protein [Chloroflexi bacterium]|nr:HEPN domain-containing protein [Chloroflexota bacterium]